MVPDSAVCPDSLFPCCFFNSSRFCSMSWSLVMFFFDGSRFCSMSWYPVSMHPLSEEMEIFWWEDRQLQSRTMTTTSSAISSTASSTLTIPLALRMLFAFYCCSFHHCLWSRLHPTFMMPLTSVCFYSDGGSGGGFYLHTRIFFFFFFLQLYCPSGISPVGNLESQLRQGCTTQPTVHAGCFSVSIIYWHLTWTTASFTCTQTLTHAIAHRGVQTP